jgi:hypothetical protein
MSNSVRYSVDDKVSEHLKLRVGSEKLAEHLGRYGSVRGLSAQSCSFYISLQDLSLISWRRPTYTMFRTCRPGS